MSKFERQVLGHPAVITDPEDLRVGQEVALGYIIIPPIGNAIRTGQGLMGFVAPGASGARFEGAKRGFDHTPRFGIVLAEAGIVAAINPPGVALANPSST